MNLKTLVAKIKSCRECVEYLPFGPKPLFTAGENARIALIGQAPGRRVHESGTTWDDASGDRLRGWLGISKEIFYDTEIIAQVPMGFCYPGKGKSGDLPPRKECAPLWHKKLFREMPNIKIKILIGNYALRYYHSGKFKNLADAVKNSQYLLPEFFVLPHPSPRNISWFQNNPWFEKEALPVLRRNINSLLNKP